MSTIRRQSILSSGIIYFGFALGFINTILFTREGGFTQEQYGLMGLFIAFANVMYSFANLGMQAYIYKFYPYYNDNLPPSKNDMIALALLTSIIGFVLVMVSGLVFKDWVIRKYAAHSADFITYYYWIFPFGFGLTIYSILEAYAWQLKKSVLTNFLREVQWRLYTTVLIVLVFTGLIRKFDSFIKWWSLNYIVLAATLFFYLAIKKEIHLNLNISRVTKKFFRKILTLCMFIWSGGLVYNISFFFAQIVIAAVVPNGLAFVAIYTLAQYIASLMQAPQRGIIAASIAPLSKAWKDKDYKKINHIYHRSSINQLIFSAGIFILIWINFTDGVFTFHLKQTYQDAKYVFLFIGLRSIIDMGTGLNSQIISTSVFWRFDFFTGIILLLLTLPLNYILAKEMGAVGPAIADLITFSIYNGIRYWYLFIKFRMQPFTQKSAFTLLLALFGYFICHFAFSQHYGILWIFMRSLSFIFIYLYGIILLKLTPDLSPVWKTIMERIPYLRTRK